jgi:ribonuclease HI
MKVKKVIIFTDGASLGNPGQAAIGAIIKDEEGRLIARLSRAHWTSHQ